MTAAEYLIRYNAAKNRLFIVERRIQNQLLEVYIQASRSVAQQIRRATRRQLSQYTISGLESIDNQIRESADIIAERIEMSLPIAISESYSAYADIEVEYMKDIANLMTGFAITEVGLRNIVVRINEDLARATFNLQFQDGRGYSQRIWDQFNSNGIPIGAHGDYQYRIQNLISAGTVQGRDPLQIAEDLNQYIRGGKRELVRRYGTLQRGTQSFARRISNRVDWRAVRLVRSVQNSAMQLASLESARINPAHSGNYNWVKTRGNPVDPDGSRNASGLRCIDLQRMSPYLRGNVPSYQHPNCSCRVQPILRDRREFDDAVRAFVNGSDNYITDWYDNVYSPVAG